MSNLFTISYRYRNAASDCTIPYDITVLKKCTVREFINEWLKDKREWGYFGIHNKDSTFDIFGSPKCEYSHGEITSDPLPDYILDSAIKHVTGSGGWSRSDFLFWI